MPSERPFGVTFLAFLEVLAGIATLAGGTAMMSLLWMLPDRLTGINTGFPTYLLPAIGPVSIVLGIILFLLAYGSLKGRGWAWTLAMILALMAIIAFPLRLIFLAPLGYMENLMIMVPGILINLIVIAYLSRPHVRIYFGKK